MTFLWFASIGLLATLITLDCLQSLVNVMQAMVERRGPSPTLEGVLITGVGLLLSFTVAFWSLVICYVLLRERLDKMLQKDKAPNVMDATEDEALK